VCLDQHSDPERPSRSSGLLDGGPRRGGIRGTPSAYDYTRDCIVEGLSSCVTAWEAPLALLEFLFGMDLK
jgi:hypothetical protein